MLKLNLDQNRLFLLSWMTIPIILVWISVSYLVGLTNHPIWDPANNVCLTSAVAPAPPKLASFTWQHTGLISIWFDDGWKSQYYTAFPLLQQKKLPAAIAVVTGYVGLPDYLNWAQLKRMQYLGWETTAHTKTHNCDLIKEDIPKIEDELIGSKRILEAEGLMADNFVTPCGADSPQLIDIAKKNYLSLRSSWAGLNPIPVTDLYRIKTYVLNNTTTLSDVVGYIKEARDTKQWLILTFHQIDNSRTEYAISPALFNQIADLIEASKLPVVLPSQVLQLSDTNLTSL